MTALHQPSDDILLKYASGVLDPGIRLLVDVYLARTPAAASRLAIFEAFAGEELPSAPPTDLTAGSLDRALARIAGAAQPPAPAPRAIDNLADIPHGRWRWAGRGTKIASVPVPDARTRVFLLRIAPGRAMLDHGHAGREFTLILEGAYRDETGSYSAGSFIEESGDAQHRPEVEGDADCLCLIAMEGTLVAPGMMGAVARWMMR